jgi:hypothetical protein
MRAAEAQRVRTCTIVKAAMKVVPWWFQTLAHVMAVVFALWLGLHIYAPVAWIVIYALAAVLSAALPFHRNVGFVGLAVGIAIGASGTYLLRDSWKSLSLDALLQPKGGLAGNGRDMIVFAIAGVWLVIGSAFRTQRA